jgi:hypothetical protein
LLVSSFECRLLWLIRWCNTHENAGCKLTFCWFRRHPEHIAGIEGQSARKHGTISTFGRPIPTNAGDAIALCLSTCRASMFGNSLFFVNDNYGVEFSSMLSEKPNLLLSRSLMLVTRTAWTKRLNNAVRKNIGLHVLFSGSFRLVGGRILSFDCTKKGCWVSLKVYGCLEKL